MKLKVFALIFALVLLNYCAFGDNVENCFNGKYLNDIYIFIYMSKFLFHLYIGCLSRKDKCDNKGKRKKISCR